MSSIHASAFIVGGVGILVRGPSGAGKSRLAALAIGSARREGRFAALVADDRVHLARSGDRLVARPPAGFEGLIELRTFGIVPIGWEAAAVLRFVIDLVPGRDLCRLPAPEERSIELLGVVLPCFATSSPDAALLWLPSACATALGKRGAVLPLAFAAQHANVHIFHAEPDALSMRDCAC